jgi:hypothetical protein
MMTDAVTISLIGAMATVLVSSVNAFLALASQRIGRRNEQQLTEAKHSLTQTNEAVAAIRQQTDGMTAALVQTTADAERAKGLAQGEASAKTAAALLESTAAAEFARGLKQGQEAPPCKQE